MAEIEVLGASGTLLNCVQYVLQRGAFRKVLIRFNNFSPPPEERPPWGVDLFMGYGYSYNHS
ncbi:MAG: hypothetical protein GWO26_28560 [Phycisphaerae bacterium]|nr:hypothetical protein [Phycisphaerae bacterium]